MMIRKLAWASAYGAVPYYNVPIGDKYFKFHYLTRIIQKFRKGEGLFTATVCHKSWMHTRRLVIPDKAMLKYLRENY